MDLYLPTCFAPPNPFSPIHFLHNIGNYRPEHVYDRGYDGGPGNPLRTDKPNLVRNPMLANFQCPVGSFRCVGKAKGPLVSLV